MTEQPSNLESTRRARFNTIWLVPLIAALVAGWMVYDSWSQRGPEITIVAKDADGLEAGKTKVKARNVDIGEVTNIKLSDDFTHALITLQMNKGTEKLLKSNTKFWVVKPRIGKEGISGLGTLLSGSYINMEPGNQGKRAREYTMLSKPPLSTINDKGIRVRLYSTQTTKLEVGTPINFRGYEVGYVEDAGFDLKRDAITYQLFIHAPYNKLINSHVKFWMTSGLSVQGTAKGIEVKMGSLQTLITGGISFGEIGDIKTAMPVKDLTEFKLFSSKQEAEDNRYNKFINYVMLFYGSVSGLESGSPVEYNGVRIGTVTQVPFAGATIDKLRSVDNPPVPILVRIEPQRLETSLKDSVKDLDEWRSIFADSFKRGMRATLNTSNLLTGGKIVSVKFVKDAAPQKITHYGKYLLFPTTTASLATMQEKVEVILNKLAALPLDKTVNSLNSTLAELDKVAKSTSDLLNQQQTKQLPAKLSGTLDSLHGTLSDYKSEGVVGKKLQQSLTSLQRTLDELQPLIQEIRQKPNALIFGKPKRDDIEPKAPQRK
ncbi:intermembrane transport protein PqiB [Vibrio profundum]|uniref:intermembrane transport protein PqiB n=1 Tax=Vibrio profundum TaxID=2910247 RepID=UPI003D0A9C89